MTYGVGDLGDLGQLARPCQQVLVVVTGTGLGAVLLVNFFTDTRLSSLRPVQTLKLRLTMRAEDDSLDTLKLPRSIAKLLMMIAFQVVMFSHSGKLHRLLTQITNTDLTITG
jgi:hypothetical protein